MGSENMVLVRLLQRGAKDLPVGTGSCYGRSGLLLGATEGGNRLDSGHLPLVTTPPVQEGRELEHKVGRSETGSHKSDQVFLNLPASQIEFTSFVQEL